MLQFIGIAEDEKPIHLPGALPAESVFDVLSRQCVDYSYLMFPTLNCDDDGTLARALEGIRERRRLYCVQFSDAEKALKEDPEDRDLMIAIIKKLYGINGEEKKDK